jgi:hypothetical protein
MGQSGDTTTFGASSHLENVLPLHAHSLKALDTFRAHCVDELGVPAGVNNADLECLALFWQRHGHLGSG